MTIELKEGVICLIENRLKILLDERGKSLYWLSRETGIKHDRLSVHYYDTATMIQHRTLELICKVLNCTPGDLLVIVQPPQQSTSARPD